MSLLFVVVQRAFLSECLMLPHIEAQSKKDPIQWRGYQIKKFSKCLVAIKLRENRANA